MQLVIKTPITNPYLVEIFQPMLTFVKEAYFYSDIIPTIQHVEEISNIPQSERIDAFFKCFGARVSLQTGAFPLIWVLLLICAVMNFNFLDAKCADGDAVILLENAKAERFINVNRKIGFNSRETSAVLKVIHITKMCF